MAESTQFPGGQICTGGRSGSAVLSTASQLLRVLDESVLLSLYPLGPADGLVWAHILVPV